MGIGFYPVDEVPDVVRVSQTIAKDGTKKWTYWMDYWDEQHQLTFGRHSGIYKPQRPKYKKMIESTIELRGEELFKQMIDWVFVNYALYPKWEVITPNLVCGSHGWSNMVALKCQGQQDLDLNVANW